MECHCPRPKHTKVGAYSPQFERCKAAIRESSRRGWLYVPPKQQRCERGGAAVASLRGGAAVASRNVSTHASADPLIRAFEWNDTHLDRPRQAFDLRYLRSRLSHPGHHRSTTVAETLTARDIDTAICPTPAPVNETEALALADGSGRCTDGAAGLQRTTRLLIGVQSTVRSVSRRDAIRATWLRWTDGETLTCFVIGGLGLSTAQRAAVADENVPRGDVLTLRGAGDGRCFLNLAKMWAWWRHAAARFLRPGSPVTHVGRVDDDVFVALPRLQAVLRRPLHCRKYLLFGSLAFSGYNAVNLTKCGFSWGQGKGPYRRSAFHRYGCAAHGAHPPVPFANGWFQVLSTALARHVGTSAAIRAFVRRSVSARIDTERWGHDRHEDVVLGYWLANDFGHERITYVDANFLLKNLGCFKNSRDYRWPRRESLAIHYAKMPSAQQYLMGVLAHGRPHNSYNCTVYAGVA